MTVKLTPGRIAVLVAVLAVAVTGVSYAAIPAADGTISACKDQKGTLKVIDAESGQTCSANQQPLTWNQQGQQGPAGQNGVSGYQVVYAGSSPYDSTAEKYASATCPSGKQPVGGGASTGFYSGTSYLAPEGVAIVASRPSGNDWTVVAKEMVPYDGPWELHAHAVCVTAL
jgi:hypothetical protein